MFGFRKYYKIQSKDGKVKYRKLVCNNEGIRPMKFTENKKVQRVQRPLTRTS